MQETSYYQDKTKSLIFHIILVLTIVLYLFTSYLTHIYIYIYIFFFLLGGLPFYGVYDSFVEYPYDDVAYCH